MGEALSDFDGLLDWAALSSWIEAAGLPGQGPVTEAVKLTGGSQNNLFLLSRGSERFVLRRPPKHPRKTAMTPCFVKRACWTRLQAAPYRIRACSRAARTLR